MAKNKNKSFYNKNVSPVYWIPIMMILTIVGIVMTHRSTDMNFDTRSKAATSGGVTSECTSTIPNAIVIGPGCRYDKISLGIKNATAGQTVDVLPGMYNEGIVLKNLVNIHLRDGVTIFYTPERAYHGKAYVAITDGGNPVTTSITGSGIIKTARNKYGSAAQVFVMSNPASNINLTCTEIDGTAYDAINITGGTANINCNIVNANYHGIFIYPASGNIKSVIFNGNISSSNQNTIAVIVSSHPAGSIKYVSINGNINYAGRAIVFHGYPYDSTPMEMEFSGEITRTNNGPAIQYAGDNAKSSILRLKDVIVRAKTVAINDHSGTLIELDNVKLITSAVGGIGIGNEAIEYTPPKTPAPVKILNTSYTNHPNSSKVPISGQMILDPNLN